MNSVDSLVSWLEQHDSRIDLRELQLRLDDEGLDLDAFAGHVHFDEQRYARNLVAHGPQFYALLLCWLPGQASPIHDHRGASCGVRVIQGTATETSFRWQGERLVEDSVTTMLAGEVCGSFDDDIHEIRNDAADNLVTLHVYSPYLDNINLYERESGRVRVFSDPLIAELSA